MVLLSTPTAVEMPEVSNWIHHSQIKSWKRDEEDVLTGAQYPCKPLNDLKLLFKKVLLRTDN